MTTTETNNTTQVAKILEAFGRWDIPGILDQLAENVRFTSHLDPIVPWAGEFSGKKEVGSFFQALGSAVEVTDHPANDVVAQDATVVVMGDVHFRVRETGKAGSSCWVYIFKLANGEVQSYDQFNDPGLAEAFR